MLSYAHERWVSLQLAGKTGDIPYGKVSLTHSNKFKLMLTGQIRFLLMAGQTRLRMPG